MSKSSLQSSKASVVWKPLLEDLSEHQPRQNVSSRFGFLVDCTFQASKELSHFDSIESISEFIQPSISKLQNPLTIKNMSLCLDRIFKAIKNNEKIAIYADYDVDGMCSLALLKSFFDDIFYENIVCYQPNRFREGYGLNIAALESLKTDLECSLVITVDNGITALDEVAWAKKNGLDIIITDHHLPSETLPDTPFILNPQIQDEPDALKELCGAGVALFLMMALKIRLKESNYFHENQIEPPETKNFLDYFCLATIADQVPLVGENRRLLKFALKSLASSNRPGVKALIEHTINSPEIMSARDIAFSVVPKLNAASRMDQLPKAMKLLLAKGPVEAEESVRELLALNEQRVEVQKKVLDEATAQAESFVSSQINHEHAVLVLSGDWHEGVLGIVASKIAENFKRPAIILSKTHEGSLRGSMRTFGKAHCVDILSHCGKFLNKFGGHPQAAGLDLNEAHLNEFRKMASDFYIQQMGLGNEQTIVEYICEMKPEINFFEVKKFLELEPFGQKNKEPLFLIKNVLASKIKVLKEQHLRVQFDLGISGIGFFLAPDFFELNEQFKSFDFLASPKINRFRGQDRVQWQLEHVRGAIESF